MLWTDLRKGSTHLHVEYGHAHTNSLFGHAVRARAANTVDLSIDLNPNLRGRNKSTNTYYDARELADGAIDRLTLVQLADEHILGGLERVLQHCNGVPDEWTLLVELEGQHRFRVQPQVRSHGTLCLYVVKLEAVSSNAFELTKEPPLMK